MHHLRADSLTPTAETTASLGLASSTLCDGPPDPPTTTAHTRAADRADLPHQALVDLLPEAYAAVDVGTRRFALVNQAAQRLLGYSQAELLAMSPADVIVPADGARLELAFQLLAPGTISRREWLLRARDGRTVPVSVTSVPVVLGERVVIQLIAHDLSEEAPSAAQRTLLALANDRLAAILRISRAFAEGEPGGDHVMQVILDEAMAMVGADHGGITLWDAPNDTLMQVYSSNGRSNGISIGLETSLSGRAALSRRPVISNDYQAEYGRGTPAGRFGSLAGVAAPMLHEGRLIGVLSVGTCLEGRRFGPDASEALELLAGMAASMLGTLERAQLQAVTLAARELAHRLNNDLALAVGTIDMLRDSPTVSPALHQLIEEAAAGLGRVGEQLRRLQQLTRFQTRETPVGPALDLDRSTE